MELKQLQYFTICARCGSMSKAAEQLYTSQPHVSTVIKSLEQDLSFALFHRQANGITLTRQGEKVYEYACNILQDLNQMQLSCRKACGQQLSLMSNSSKRMAAFFAKFCQKNMSRSISFTYLEGGLEKILENLVSERIELGFSFLNEDKSDILENFCKKHQLKREILTYSDMVLYVGKNNPLYGLQKISVEKLKDLRFVQLEEDYFGLDNMLLKVLPLGEPAHRIISTNSNNGIIQILLNTSFCNVGSYWKKDFYLDRDIRLIPIEGYEKKIHFIAVYRELSPLGEEYLQEIKTALLDETV